MREAQATSSVGVRASPVARLELRQQTVRDLAECDENEPSLAQYRNRQRIPGCSLGFVYDASPVGYGLCSVYRVSSEIFIAFTEQQVEAPTQLCITGDGLVTIRIMLAGGTCFHGDRFEPIELQGAQVTVFYHRKDEELLHEVRPGLQRVVTLLACPDYLRRELGWSFDNDNSAPMRLPLSPSVENMARAVMQNPHAGARHATFVRARALDILCALAAEWDEAAARDPEEGQRLTVRDRERILVLREELKAMAHHPPSMSQLARHAGMNKTKLMRGFKQIFGETIADFCRRLRLEEARAMLLSEGLTIGEIAVAVGYQHQSSFTAAFSAHFGFPPKALQRGATMRPPHGTRGLN